MNESGHVYEVELSDFDDVTWPSFQKDGRVVDRVALRASPTISMRSADAIMGYDRADILSPAIGGDLAIGAGMIAVRIKSLGDQDVEVEKAGIRVRAKGKKASLQAAKRIFREVTNM